MPELLLKTVSLAASGVLTADLPLAQAIERLAGAEQPIFLVRRGAEARGLLGTRLRSAWHSGVAGTTQVWDLADAALAAASEGEALASLRKSECADAALVVGADSAQVVLRTVPPITHAVVMAGGLGQRLLPLTQSTPKPLLEVAGEPLLTRILRRLRAHGVARVWISVHHLAEQIKDVIKDGSAHGLAVEYLEEKSPLDTGAGLVLLPRIDAPFLLVNGDVLTNADLSALARAHVLGESLATVGTYLFAAPLPYGVARCEGERIVAIDEKPVFRYPINAGVYAFAPEIKEHVPEGAPLPMVPFLNGLIAKGHKVSRFPLVEYWNDVGAPADYQRAQEDAKRL